MLHNRIEPQFLLTLRITAMTVTVNPTAKSHFVKTPENINKSTNHGVGIGQEVTQAVQETLIFDQLCVDIMQLCNADSSCLAHIGIFILQTLAQWLAEVFSNLVNPDTAHRPHSQCSDQRIAILTILITKCHNRQKSASNYIITSKHVSYYHRMDECYL